jgi:hypothetical protein
MIADGITFQAIFFQDVAAVGQIRVVAEGAFHVKVVAPAGEFEAIVTEFGHLLTERLEGDIPPLAAGDGNWTGHE